MTTQRRLAPLGAAGTFSTTSNVFQTALSITNRAGVLLDIGAGSPSDELTYMRVVVDGVEVHHARIPDGSALAGMYQPGLVWFFNTSGSAIAGTWGGASPMLNLGFNTSLLIQIRSHSSGLTAQTNWYVEVEPV